MKQQPKNADEFPSCTSDFLVSFKVNNGPALQRANTGGVQRLEDCVS